MGFLYIFQCEMCAVCCLLSVSAVVLAVCVFLWLSKGRGCGYQYLQVYKLNR